MLDGSLKIESIRLIPGPTCHSVKVLFSMNTKGKGHVTVNYGPSKDLEFQSSAADLKVSFVVSHLIRMWWYDLLRHICCNIPVLIFS